MERAVGWARALLGNRISLWIAFVLVHLVLGLINLYSPSNPMGDVRYVYTYWIDLGLHSNYWVGIDSGWVYPIMAMLPMLLAHVFGADLYPSTWLSMVMLLDAIALATLTGWGRRARRLAAGWWWVGFTALLGPIALSRIDSPSIAIAMVGVLFVSTYPLLAGVLITVATWIKVWPAALVAAVAIAVRERASVLVSVVVTSVLIVVGVVSFGGAANVFSFIGQQTGRGLQIEAPVSTIWMWRALAKAPGTWVYYDQQILTFQVGGPGSEFASAVMTPIMAVAVLIVALLGLRAVRRGTPSSALLPMLSLAFVTCLIAFNKVGSPQYIGWLAVPVVLALASGREARTWMRVPIVLVPVIAFFTQVIYPYLYDWLVWVDPFMIVMLTVRNVLLVALWLVCVERLWAMGRRMGDYDPALELSTLDDAGLDPGRRIDRSTVPQTWPLDHAHAPRPEETR